MTRLTHQSLQQLRDDVSPFDETNPGFSSGWWGYAGLGRVQQRRQLYTFAEESGEEVARARLLTGETVYHPVSSKVLARHATAVERLEVHVEFRRRSHFNDGAAALQPPRRYGTKTLRQLEQLHPNSTLFAFAGGDQASEEARDALKFWHSTGWEFIPGPDGSRDAPLFVLWR